MARDLKASRARLSDRVKKELRIERVVGDLDEIDLKLLETCDGRVHISTRAGLDGAFPDGVDALDLRAGTQQVGSKQRAGRYGAAPREYLLGR